METGIADGGLRMTLVFLLEEKSMKAFLDILLPKILPPDVNFYTIAHEGKSDLKKSLPIKLKAWNIPDSRFLVVQDQDSNDCRALKQELLQLCGEYKREILVRIACHELEAWYWGDLEAVQQAYHKDLGKIGRKRAYRIPDNIVSPKRELQKLLPEHQQIDGARRIAEYIEVDRNTSASFHALIEGVRKMCYDPDKPALE